MIHTRPRRLVLVQDSVYASIVTPRPAVQAHTIWIPQTIRAQIKAQPSQADLEAQDEWVTQLLRAAGPCLTDLDLRGFMKINARHLERLVGWISAQAVVVPKPEAAAVSSLLSATVPYRAHPLRRRASPASFYPHAFKYPLMHSIHFFPVAHS